MKKKPKNFFWATALLYLGTAEAAVIPFDSGRWEFVDSRPPAPVEYELVEHLGQQSLYLRLGFAIIGDLEGGDGIIEYDVAFDQQPGDGNSAYLGHVWHFQDSGNHEHFYVRPQRSGDLKSTQYTPVINGSGTDVWYRAYSRPVELRFNDWNHIKCVMSGGFAEVYINDMTTPAMVFPQEHAADSGKMGLMSGGIDLPVIKGAYYANFNFTAVDNPPLATAPQPVEAPPGTLTAWAISDKVEDSFLAERDRLTEADRNMTWTVLAAEDSGFTNFAKVQSSHDPQGKRQTAFSRVTLHSERAQLKKLTLQSNPHNPVKVYFNGTAMLEMEVDDELDFPVKSSELYLPLRAGDNDLWIGVTDTKSGGWGIQAALEDLEGVRVTTAAPALNLDTASMGDCLASYSLAGNLHIPCVAVPNGPHPEDGSQVFQVELNQAVLFDYLLFRLNMGSVQPAR